MQLIVRDARSLGIRLLLLGLLAALSFSWSTSLMASGAIGGAGGVSQYGQVYKQGKAVFFQKVACAREGCMVSRTRVNSDFARELFVSLSSRGALRATESETDKIANSLTSDEAEKVHHYLARRFNLAS